MAEDGIFNTKKIELPENVRLIISRLEKDGFEAYAVGGCVRDSVLGRRPQDWDITTSALPADIKRIFRRTVDTGIEHGTVTVLIGSERFEVTTYRVDGEYLDGRHPESVSFTANLKEDLKRRDFTINAMAYNESAGIIDLFGGIDDLKRGVIRCVGEANERFDEDALRILRAVRFAAQLDFDIDMATRDAICTHAPRLKAVSRERVMTELTKLLCSAHIERVEDIFQMGMIPYTAKNLRKVNIAQLMSLKGLALSRRRALGASSGQQDEPVHSGALRPESPDAAFDLCRPCGTDKRYIRFAFLCEGMTEPELREMLKDLKSDNHTLKSASVLLKYVLTPFPADPYGLKRIMSGIEPDLFEDLMYLKLASHGSKLYESSCAGEDLEAVLSAFAGIAGRDEPVYISDLAVTGNDIIACGMAEGPAVGQLLKSMLDEVHRCPEHNTAEFLLNRHSG